jgi:predicted HTH transcriptional regulator
VSNKANLRIDQQIFDIDSIGRIKSLRQDLSFELVKSHEYGRTVFPISEEALQMEQGEKPSEEILPDKTVKELPEEKLPSKSAEASYNEADDGLIIHQKLPDKTHKILPDKMADTTRKILDIIRKNPRISRQEVALILGDITENGVKYHLVRLKKMGIIKRVGSPSCGHWEII